MRHLKSFSLMAALAILLSFVVSVPNTDAATIKRNLTIKSYADMYYLEWTGSVGVVTADDMLFMADSTTANVYGVDPMYFRMDNNRAATTGPWKSEPGLKWPEKACVYVTQTGDADATTSDVYLTQSATKNGTFVKVGGTAQTITSVATTATIDLAAVPAVPQLFWKLVLDPTTATDSILVTGVRVMACDD
jgi:hypothetical protein